MKALIVGINSFVGPFLAAHLSSCGYKVSGTYRTNVPDKDQLPETEFYKCHLNDYTQVESVLNAVKPDFIFNLAGFTSPFLSWQHPDKAFESNTTGVANLITASISICPKCRILLVSTGNLYNIQNGARITEQSPLTAKNPYAVSKLAAEQYALLMAEKGTDIIIVRPFNHTGPGQKDDFAVPCFAKQINEILSTNKNSQVQTGNIESYRDFLDVRDVVRAYRLCAEKGQSGQIYNIASGSATKMKDILYELIKLSGKKISVHTDPTRFLHEEPVFFSVDTTRLKDQTGWIPSISIKQTLADLLEWLQTGRRKLTLT